MRLTKKTENGFTPTYERETKENYYDLVSKLGQLEDIEEEYAIQDTTDLRRRLDLADRYAELSEQLGIDLITLFNEEFKKIAKCYIKKEQFVYAPKELKK